MPGTKALVIAGLVAAAGVGAYMKFGGCGSCGSCETTSPTAQTTNVALATNAAPVLLAAGAVGTIAAEPGASYKVDLVHSSVLYGIMHQSVARHWGRFNSFTGTFLVDPANTSASMIDITVKADSIDSGNKGRDEHLRGTDFFSAKEFADITFKSASFTKTTDTTLEAKGTLTLLGKSKEVSFPVEFLGTGKGRGGTEVAGFEAKLTIKRSDFGMNNMIGPLGDDVTLIISCEGSR